MKKWRGGKKGKSERERGKGRREERGGIWTAAAQKVLSLTDFPALDCPVLGRPEVTGIEQLILP